MKDAIIVAAAVIAGVIFIAGIGSLMVYDYSVCRSVGHSVFYCIRNR